MTLHMLDHLAPTDRTTDLADDRNRTEPVCLRAGHGIGAGVGTGVGTVDRPETDPRTDPAGATPPQLTGANQCPASGPERPKKGLLIEGVAQGRQR
jgi:hypothetical protein